MWGRILFTAAAVAGFVSLANAKLVVFNDEIARSYADGRVKFLSDVSEVPVQLMGMDEYLPEEELIPCSVTPTRTNNGTVTVLLAISKCLSQEDMDTIEDWIAELKADELSYFQDGEAREIEFSTTIVPGACQALSEKNAQGRFDENNGTWHESFLSEDVLPADVERISRFAKFGRVLSYLPDARQDIPIAVISFVNNDKSFEEVEKFERLLKVEHTFNFEVCKDGKSCEGHFNNCIRLLEAVDVFMYNPFTITRSFHCENLQNGIPVSYINKDNERACFCSCTAGSERRVDYDGNHVCEPVTPEECPCVWNKDYGYKYAVETCLDVCSFDHITNWGVHVAFPMDNYVADKRVNSHDDGYGYDVSNGPHIKLSTKSIDKLDEVDWSENYSWREYQQHRREKIDGLTYSRYGKYELELYAKDYSKDATCTGCLAIVDHYRPQHTTQCPASFCDNTTSTCEGHDAATGEMTTSNLDRAHGLVQDFYRFQSEAKNDACGGERCDDEEHEVKDFYDNDYSEKDYDAGGACFDKDAVREDFFNDDRSKSNPLVTRDGYTVEVKQEDDPVPSGQCTRCCKYRVHLKELWTDFTCGNEYDTESCDGLDDETCSFKQCLTMNGDTIATASARIREEHVTETEKVLDELVQKGFQAHTQIHRFIRCPELNATNSQCRWRAKVTELLETKVAANFELPKYTHVSDYVFWRYKVGGDEWRLLNDDPKHTFAEPETMITLEAWTTCGRVRKFFFYVHLHTNSEINVCDYFPSMWYQTSVSRLPIASELCAYPQSDFAELTFDYRPNAGLEYDRNKVRMHADRVRCWMRLEGREFGGKVVEVTGESPEIIQRFAVELNRIPKTSATTQIHVSCEFRYKRFDDSRATRRCRASFTVKDCDGPQIDIPDGECRFDECAGKGPNRPGPFEACGGNVVRSNEQSTWMTTNDRTCCQSCYSPTECVPILGLPNVDEDIKRCVPQVGGGDNPYAYGVGPEGEEGEEGEEGSEGEDNEDEFDNPPAGEYETAEGAYVDVPAYVEEERAQMFMATAMAATREHTMALAAAGGSLLVALVALVVVKHRRAQSAKETVVEDAYYPLLH